MAYRRALMVTLILLGASLPMNAHAGGWTQPQGEFYAKVWNRSILGDQAFTLDGSIAAVPESFQDHQLWAYLEYGLTDALSLVVSGSPLGLAKYGDEITVYGSGATLGVRAALLTGRFPLAVEVRGGARTSIDPLGSGTIAGSPFVIQPVVGSALFDVELQQGVALPAHLWLTASLGTRLFSNFDLSPAITGFLQFGWDPEFGLVLDLHANFFHSVDDIEVINVLGAGNTRYLGFGLGISYWFTDHFALFIGGEGVAYAESNAATPSLMVGFELR
jgi:hypothetical protein